MTWRVRGSWLVVAAVVAVVAWWLWPRASLEEAPSRRVRVERPKERRIVFSPALPDTQGTAPTGSEVTERLCDLCADGLFVGEVCAPCEEDEPAVGRLFVDVVDEEGRPTVGARVWVQGCEATREGPTEFAIDAGTCVVHAGRKDGALWARAEPHQLDVPIGEERYVQLELSSARTGGLGVSIRPDANGVRVMAVLPGTPADLAGLKPGDLIVEVDGLDTRDLEIREFIATMTGPEDTEVDFVLQFETDTGIGQEPLTITRQFLEG